MKGLWQRAGRGLPALLLAGVHLGSAAPAGWAQAPANQQTTPPASFREFTVNFADRTINRVLPFDEYFILQGGIPDTIEIIDVSYLERRNNFNVRRKPGTPPTFECFELRRVGRGKKRHYVETNTGPCNWAADVAHWQRSPLVDIGTDAAPVMFRVTMPPLEAARYYAFKFDLKEKLDPEKLAQFQDLALDDFRDALPLTTATSLDNTDATFAALQKELVRELSTLAGEKGLEFAAEKNFFNTSFSQLDQKLRTEFIVETQAVMTLNAQVHDDLTQNWPEFQVSFQENLRKLTQAVQDGQPLDRLLEALDAPETSILIQAHADDLQVLRLTDAELLRVQKGLPAEPTGSEPAAVLNPRGLSALPQDPSAMAADAAARATEYETVRQQLEGVSELLDRLVSSGGRNRSTIDRLVEQGSLTTADVTALRSLRDVADKARGDAFVLRGVMTSIADTLKQREAALQNLVQRAVVQAQSVVLLLDASTIDTFQTRQTWYLSADFGLAAAPELEDILRYVGMNIYFRPVNKQVPLSFRGGFGRRFSLTLGISQGSIDDATNTQTATQTDLFSSNNLLLGAGLRVTDSLRVIAGAVVFKQPDPNPLVNDETLTYTPYFGLSFDWDIRSAFTRFGFVPPQDGQPSG